MFALRPHYLWATFLTLALLALVVLLQIEEGVLPNPLMILNTACLLILTVLMVGVTWWCPKKKGQLVFAFSMLFFCLLGLLFSMRHILLEYFYSPVTPSCLSHASIQQWMSFLRDAWMRGVHCPHGEVLLFNIPLHFICLGWYSLVFIFVCFQLCEIIAKSA